MTLIAWQRVLDSLGVEYVLGPVPNVRRDHVGIRCPFCQSDTKYHFGINLLSGQVRGCWRNKDHWLSPSQLVAELGSMSLGEARRVVYDDEPVTPSDNDLQLMARRLEGEEPVADEELEIIEWPSEFHEFEHRPSRTGRRFNLYLQDRGFNVYAAQHYDLRWCAVGQWGPRILFPLRRPDGDMVGWTGRAIGRARTKYMTYPSGDSVQHLMFGCEHHLEGEILVVCEGPFDAMKVDWFAGKRPWHAVALLGLNLGTISKLVDVASRFRHLVLMLDRGTESQALDLASRLRVLEPQILQLPEGVDDPGELLPDEVHTLLDSIA